MMFANLMQQTKKIIQEKYLKNDGGNTTATTIEIEATDEQLEEKTQELKDQIFGRYLQCLMFTQYIIGLTIVSEQTDIIRTIKDPEKPATLEDLNVVYENGVEVSIQNSDFI